MRRLNIDARTVHYLEICCQELIFRDLFDWENPRLCRRTLTSSPEIKPAHNFAHAPA